MRTELIKIRDPFKKVFDRRSYYTKIELVQIIPLLV